MHFKRSTVFLLATAALSLITASCGKLADKPESSRTILPGKDVGCYDKLGEKVKRYFNGQIEEAEWLTTFDCVKDQITFFRKYVVGSVPYGYDSTDIGILIRKFLIVNRPVSDSFVLSLFDLKASAFGGDTKTITHRDLEEFIRLNEVLRKESLILLPYLQARHRVPTGQNLMKLADAIAVFGDHFANYLSSLNGSVDVSKDTFIPFAREILTINGGDATLVDRYGDFVRNLKAVFAGGSADTIEKRMWATLVREGTTFGGLLLAYRDMEDNTFAYSEEQDQFLLDLTQRAQKALNRVMNRHGNGISLERFYPIIDTLPWKDLTPEKRAAIKKDLPGIITRGMQNREPGKLTPQGIANVLGLYEKGMRSQIHLKKIYRHLPTNPSSRDFEVEARKYLDTRLEDYERSEVRALIEVSKHFIGLFPEESSQIQFTNAMRDLRTKNHMIRMSWFRHVVNYMVTAYAPGADSTASRRVAQADDLVVLMKDFINILLEWKMADPAQTPKVIAEKRFREANLFMPTSNGDKYMDEVEGTYYLAFLFSSGALSGKIFDTIVEEWRACPITGRDILGSDAMDAVCFRKQYFGHPEVFWTQFPGLQVAYAQMSETEKSDLRYAMEKAARKGGYSNNPIGPYDIDSFAALPHYVEDMMERFDGDDNEILDRTEILDRAFPIFKMTLSAYSNIPTFQKAILTYIVHYGVIPSNTAKLLLWWARMPFVKIEARRSDLYKVVAAFSIPPKRLDAALDSSSLASTPAFEEFSFQ